MGTVPDAKACRKCGQIKPLTEFHVCSANTDGRMVRCKTCVCLQSRDYHARNRAAMREKSRVYNAANAAQVAATTERWRQSNRERKRDSVRLWASQNQDLVRRAAHRRLERLIAGGPIYSWDEWQALCAQYGNRCLSCGEAGTTLVPLVPDHVIPLEKRGINAIANIQPLCRRCNHAKRNKIIDYRPPA